MNQAHAISADNTDFIRSQLKHLFTKGQVVELRVPKGGPDGTISGFYNNGKALAEAAAALSGRYPGVYVTLNPVDPSLFDRSPNRLTYNVDRGQTTHDDDITHRRWLLIDADPVRPADTSSTDEEKLAALEVLDRVRNWLGAQGWPAPIEADSGNGCHLLYRVDLPNDEATRQLVRGFLMRLATEFDTPAVTIDRKVSNAARICKIYGTISAKGQGTEERPHRLSRLTAIPEQLGTVTAEQLAAIQPQESASGQPQAPEQGTGTGQVNRYALTALESASGRVSTAASGTRNDTLNTEAYGIFQLVHGGALSKGTAWGILEDAALRVGLEASEIRATLLSAFDAAASDPRTPPEPKQRAPRTPRQPPQAPSAPSAPAQPGEGTAQQDEAPPQAANDNEREKGFTILGYDRDTFFFYPHEKRQITEMTRGDMTENGLLALAPQIYWLTYFSKDGAYEKVDKAAAVDWLIRTAYARGVFNPHRIRGRGAWVDDKRIVVHMGNHLIVDGVQNDLPGFRSRHIYQAEIPLPELASQALTEPEGRWLLDIAELFRWTMPASAALLAGWVALAPICGAVRWRPHIWLTGGAGCGKSTILNDYVHFLMGGLDVFAQGNSTEAGLRQHLRSDALPVLFDESEQNNEREEHRMQAVLSLIRQASSESGAQTFKGTAGGKSMHFHVRSMFCLASIQVGIKQQADRERLTVLALRPKHDDRDAAAGWQNLKHNLHLLRRDGGLPARLFRRAIDLLPVTMQNIELFVQVATEHFGNARDGDQYGTLLAGAWSLISSGLATRADAESMIGSYDWAEYTEGNAADDAMRALQALLEARIRIGGDEYTVAELAAAAAGDPLDGCHMPRNEAQSILRRHGLKAAKYDYDDMLLVSNNSPAVRELVAGTPYEADLRGQLLRVDGAARWKQAERFTGPPAKCIAIPMRLFV